MILPDCMMPDGADPCRGYHELQDENVKLKKECFENHVPWEEVEALQERCAVLHGLLLETENFFAHGHEDDGMDLWRRISDELRPDKNESKEK